MQKALRQGDVSCVDITKCYLKRISEQNSLNIFVEVYSEEALEKAQAIDLKIKSGSAGKLAGMVVGIKDNLCYANHKVSAASKILNGFEALFSATSIQRLIDEDAIIIGRLNCDEFAMGSANENTIYGSVQNPLDNSKVAGGSSGGEGRSCGGSGAAAGGGGSAAGGGGAARGRGTAGQTGAVGRVPMAVTAIGEAD